MTSSTGWEQSRIELKRSKERWFKLALGMHGYYLITSLHVLMIGVIFLSNHLGILPLQQALIAAIGLVTSDAVLYFVFKTEYNLRFRDPTLIALRTLIVVALVLYIQIYAGPTKASCALTIITTFALAGSHASPRTLARLNLITVGAYAATMPLIKRVEGANFNGNAELINWLTFASALSATSLAGATISTLRQNLSHSNARLAESLDKVTELATVDELTKVHNRRYVTEMMEHEVQRVSRGGATFSVCLVDIDHFKRVNDTYGHQCGDAVLKAFAAFADGDKRAGDIFARWGGEEFILFLPQSSTAVARLAAERLRRAVRELRLEELPAGVSISISIGIAEFRPHDTLAALIERADQALYRAKQSGRDRVESTPPMAIASGGN
jgi:diguanylate cyclase (GGDEF)-like protein